MEPGFSSMNTYSYSFIALIKSKIGKKTPLSSLAQLWFLCSLNGMLVLIWIGQYKKVFFFISMHSMFQVILSLATILHEKICLLIKDTFLVSLNNAC